MIHSRTPIAHLLPDLLMTKQQTGGILTDSPGPFVNYISHSILLSS